jgi:protein-tyrosine phosphatase
MNIDYHCHILPGIDDGAVDLQDSIMLAKALKNWGFERVYCTPHITSAHMNTPETIKPAFDALLEALDKDGYTMDSNIQQHA